MHIHSRAVKAMLARDGLPESSTNLVALNQVRGPSCDSNTVNTRLHIGQSEGEPVHKTVSRCAEDLMYGNRCVDAGLNTRRKHNRIRTRTISRILTVGGSRRVLVDGRRRESSAGSTLKCRVVRRRGEISRERTISRRKMSVGPFSVCAVRVFCPEKQAPPP